MLGNYKNMRQSYFYAYQISLKSIIESLSSDDIDSLNNPKQPNSLIQIRAHLDSMIKSLDDFEKSEHHPPILIRAFISKFNELITHLTESLKRRFTRKDSQTLQSSSSLKQNSPSRHLYLQTENLSIRGKYHPNH